MQERSLRPLGALAVAGAVGLGLAAPKLLPLLDTFAGDPRLIGSTERLDLGALVTLLTSRDQGFGSRPAKVTPYGWHEWGMYISWAGLLLLLGAFVLVEGKRERALKLVGALFVLLGLGAFHPAAPWTLLHAHVPPFGSQHVPSRFLYPAVLVLALVAAAGLGRLVEQRARRWPWLDLALTIPVVILALDVARVSRLPMKSAMWMRAPAIPAGRSFHFEQEPPFQYVKRDWAGPMLLAMMGNTGVLNCYGVPRSPDRPIAALASNDPRYLGEMRIVGEGSARLVDWSPNRARAAVEGAQSGARLVYNMNYRRGWRSDLGPAEPYEGLVSVRLPAGSREVQLWYQPPGLWRGLALLGLTLSLVLLWWRRVRAEGAT